MPDERIELQVLAERPVVREDLPTEVDSVTAPNGTSTAGSTSPIPSVSPRSSPSSTRTAEQPPGAGTGSPRPGERLGHPGGRAPGGAYAAMVGSRASTAVQVRVELWEARAAPA